MVAIQHAALRRSVDITSGFGIQLDNMPVSRCSIGTVRVDYDGSE